MREGVPVTEAASQGGLHEGPLHAATGPVFGAVQPDVPYPRACMRMIPNKSQVSYAMM